MKNLRLHHYVVMPTNLSSRKFFCEASNERPQPLICLPSVNENLVLEFKGQTKVVICSNYQLKKFVPRTYPQEKGKPLPIISNHEVFWLYSQFSDDLLEEFSLLLLRVGEHIREGGKGGWRADHTYYQVQPHTYKLV